MPALHVVEEIPGDLGVLLWRSVRNVELWARTPAEARAGLFDPAAARVRTADSMRLAPEPELVAPLSVVVSLLEAPGRVDVLRLVHACRRVATWAEARGALGTALEFTQAAALASLEDPALAVLVGRLARRRAEYDRAESWFTRAIILGRQRRDWRSYALAYLGLGVAFRQRGNIPAARRMLQRALGAATRHAITDVCGMAYHDLFGCEVEAGAGFDASTLAVAAMRAYGPRDPRVARLAYDVAYHWVLHGYFAAAAQVAELLEAHPDFGGGGVAEHVLALGLTARAAGGAGDRSRFERCAAELEAALSAYERVQGDAGARENASGALLGLAHGASSLGEHELAVRAAERALALAQHRGQGRVALSAEAALQAMVHSAGIARSLEPADPRAADALVDSLTEILLAESAHMALAR
jgi:tetratricopeptide (TPR) repeat protein